MVDPVYMLRLNNLEQGSVGSKKELMRFCCRVKGQESKSLLFFEAPKVRSPLVGSDCLYPFC